MKKVCIVGVSGKLGRYMAQHALDRGYEVVGVCRERSVGKLDKLKGRITIIPGATNDRAVIRRAVAGCDGVLTVLVPWGVQQYSSGTAQAVMDYSEPNARLVFSCGWHISRDGKDVYSWKLKALVQIVGRMARFFSPGGIRRPGRGVQADICQRHKVDSRAWKRPRRGGKPGPTGVESTRGRPHPREQYHAPRGLCPFHGGSSRERRTHSRGPRDCWLPDALGARK